MRISDWSSDVCSSDLKYVLIAGVEAATFMGTREGKDSLRSKQFWEGLVGEYGATRTLTGEDGETHKQLRDVMRSGYSKESIKGRYNELIEITDRCRSEEHTSALQSLMRISYAVFCLKKKKT